MLDYRLFYQLHESDSPTMLSLLVSYFSPSNCQLLLKRYHLIQFQPSVVVNQKPYISVPPSTGCMLLHNCYCRKGHFAHETESPCPLHFKHSHWWKRRSRSKFATSHYAWGTNGVCECKMDVKSTWILTWHRMDHVYWSLGLFSKTTSWW